MGRKRKWPPVPHAHQASGQERVHLPTGDVYLGPIGSPQAKRAYARLVARLAEEHPVTEQGYSVTGELRVAELVVRWHQECQARYDPEGGEPRRYKYALAPLVKVCGTLAVGAFTLARLEDVRDEMIGRGWSRGVINHHVGRIRTMWRWAERRELVPAGSWAALAALTGIAKGDRRVKDHPPRRPCSWDDLRAVVDFADGQVGAMLLLGWHAGMRPGEARCMKVGEVDRTEQEWIYRPGRHKNAWRGVERVVVLGPGAREVLGPHLEGKGEGQWVFARARTGKPLNPESYGRLVREARARAGVTAQVIPYGARHAAKQRVTREMGLDAARALLGHASLATTDRYAAGPDEALARETARRMG